MFLYSALWKYGCMKRENGNIALFFYSSFHSVLYFSFALFLAIGLIYFSFPFLYLSIAHF